MAETFSMNFQVINVTRVRGDTFSFSFRIKESARDVVNITGFTFKLSVDTLEDPADEVTQLFKFLRHFFGAYG